MVGEGENSHAEKESRTDGPCTRGRPYGSYKKQKTIEIVELSSTITHTFTIIDYSALSKSQKKEDKSSESSSEDVNSPKQQDVVEKVDRLGTSVQDLQKVVTTLTQIIVTNPPMITHIGTHGGVPYVFNPFQTPLNTSPANQIQTEMIMSKLKPSGQTLFRSVNYKEGINKAQEQGSMTDPPIRKLFTPLEGVNNAGFYFNYQSLQSIKHDGRKLGVQIPNWAPMLFSPPKDMLLDDIDAAVAAYIFGVNKEDKKNGNEILIETKYGKGDRNLLKTLMPKGLVDQEVLNFLACMLTHQDRVICKNTICWFLPTTFSQYVCTWTSPPDILRKRYQERFMGRVEYVSKIFIPINDGNVHWFLLVIDIKRRQLTLLDSYPCTTRKEFRRRAVRKLGVFVDEMLLHESFYRFHTTTKPIISDFEIVEPEGVGQQVEGSNDCGIWVALWMMQCNFTNKYNITVTESSRMQLALDLVLKNYNTKNEEVKKLAFGNLDKLEKQHNRLVKK
ncbi:Ulp1 protease family, C-terminal catalytic domain [Sesbania bispinosa]|nr:Ulp1 protease family, C-terminal catalytic domain [Sesbania bispinosa]